MVDDARNGGLEAGYGQARLAARGFTGIIGLLILLVAAAVGTLIYVTWSSGEGLRQELIATRAVIAESNKGHDLMACVITLSLDQRRDLQKVDSKEAFQVFCPWLR